MFCNQALTLEGNDLWSWNSGGFGFWYNSDNWQRKSDTPIQMLTPVFPLFLYYKLPLQYMTTRGSYPFFPQKAFTKKGIRVYCVCPGRTDTELYNDFLRLDLTKEQQEFLSKMPKQA